MPVKLRAYLKIVLPNTREVSLCHEKRHLIKRPHFSMVHLANREWFAMCYFLYPIKGESRSKRFTFLSPSIASKH